MCVVLEKKYSQDAEVHSNDHAKDLKWQHKESTAHWAQAVSVATLQSGTQICCNLHHVSPEKRIDPSCKLQQVPCLMKVMFDD